MSAYQSNYAQVCAALFVVAADALRIAPCRERFSCLKARWRRGSLRGFIRHCWKYVPVTAQSEAFYRLKLYRFASCNKYLTSTPWEVFLQNFRDGALLGQSLQEEFDKWQLDHVQQHRPSKLILRALYGPPALSLEAATFILEPIGEEARFEIGKRLLPELERACQHLTFVGHGWKQRLELQFLHNGVIEHRPITPTMAF